MKIEKNIPIPEDHRPGPHGHLPFKKMEVGDSFLSPVGVRTRGGISSSCSYWAKKLSKERKFSVTFITAIEEENGKMKGYRVWRRT